MGVNTGKRLSPVGKLLVLSCDRVNSIIKLAGAHFDRCDPKLFRVSGRLSTPREEIWRHAAEMIDGDR